MGSWVPAVSIRSMLRAKCRLRRLHEAVTWKLAVLAPVKMQGSGVMR